MRLIKIVMRVAVRIEEVSMHTKGEWKYRKKRFNYGDDIDKPLGSIMANGWFICRIDNAPEAEANANLIAAAPELYEALKEIESTIYWGNTLEAEARHKRTQQALAKAEGKDG